MLANRPSQWIKNRGTWILLQKTCRWTYFDRWTSCGQWTPSTRAEMTLIPLHKTWQIKLLWLMDPSGTIAEMTCMHYTKLGRWTYFGQWTPHPSSLQYQSNTWNEHKFGRWTFFCQCLPPVPEQRSLAYHCINLGRSTYFGQWNSLVTRAEMPWIPLQKTWQMTLLWPMVPLLSARAEMPWISVHQTRQTHLFWPMDPPGTRAEMTCLPLHKNLEDEPNLANRPPKYHNWGWLAYQYTKLGRWNYFGWWTPLVP